MTEPVIGVGGVQGAGRKNERDVIFKKWKEGAWHIITREHDSVDISEEARRKAAGKREADAQENLQEDAEKEEAG